jgi:hypothetical protein
MCFCWILLFTFLAFVFDLEVWIRSCVLSIVLSILLVMHPLLLMSPHLFVCQLLPCYCFYVAFPCCTWVSGMSPNFVVSLPLLDQSIAILDIASTTSTRFFTWSRIASLKPKSFIDCQLLYSSKHPLRALNFVTLPLEPLRQSKCDSYCT